MVGSRRLRRTQHEVGYVEEAPVGRVAPARTNTMTGSTVTAGTMTVGAVDDEYERQADALASQVVQRLAAPDDHDAAAVAHDDDSMAVSSVDRRSVRRRARGGVASAVGPAGGVLDVSTAGEIERARGGGRPLPAGVRAGMEAGFGADFSGVRLHSGGASDRLNVSLGAQAFTVGSDVFVHSSSPRFDSVEGSHLLAHELAHTLQQGSRTAEQSELASVAEPVARGDGVVGATVRRFPAIMTSAGTKWSSEAPEVTRPGGGLSGGVYILKSKTGPVTTVVVKPIFGVNAMDETESAEQLVAGDRILEQVLRIKTPQSRIVSSGTAEFADLVALCAPKQPARPGEDEAGHDNWAPLSDAQAFVVMSEVPDGRSIASLAKEAHDTGDVVPLQKAIFTPTFMSHLGALVIGDLLVGNMDRLGFGQANLGNIMVGLTGRGRRDLFAIDTTVKLPKAFSPVDMVNKGHMDNMMANDSVRRTIDEGPERIFNLFADAVVGSIRGLSANGDLETDDNAASTAVAQQFNRLRPALLMFFTWGWDDALRRIRIYAAQLERRRDAKPGGLEGPDVTRQGLLTTATYLGDRAGGQSHDDGVGRAAAGNLINYLDEMPMKDFLAPSTDLLPPRFADPGKKVLEADWVGAPSLPTPERLTQLTPAAIGLVRSMKAAEFASVTSAVTRAHREIDAAVGATKTRGIRRKVTPRNRNLLGHTVVDASATIAGAARDLTAYGMFQARVDNVVRGLPAAKLSKGQAIRVRHDLRWADHVANTLDGNLARYRSAIDTIATTAPKMTSFGERARLEKAAKTSADRVDRIASSGRGIFDRLDLPGVIASLT